MLNNFQSSKNEVFDSFKEHLDKLPFIILIGKYDHVLGPRAIYSPVTHKNESFIRDLLRDALNTKNKYVILDFNGFYSQVCKVDIKDISARGKKQLYAIILLRSVELPTIPIIHFKRIEMIFHKIKIEDILTDNKAAFEGFYKEVSNIYIKKDEILPLESINLQIRSGVNTIQGFCELIIEEKKEYGKLSDMCILNYVEMMLDSCNEIIEALEKPVK